MNAPFRHPGTGDVRPGPDDPVAFYSALVTCMVAVVVVFAAVWLIFW